VKNKLWGTNSKVRVAKEIDFEQLIQLVSIGWRRTSMQ
jgi:hypothetical protein